MPGWWLKCEKQASKQLVEACPSERPRTCRHSLNLARLAAFPPQGCALQGREGAGLEGAGMYNQEARIEFPDGVSSVVLHFPQKWTFQRLDKAIASCQAARRRPTGGKDRLHMKPKSLRDATFLVRASRTVPFKDDDWSHVSPKDFGPENGMQRPSRRKVASSLVFRKFLFPVASLLGLTTVWDFYILWPVH